jgi:hypothetical protein
MKMHELTISDPMFFVGPEGPNRILARGLGVVYGSPAFQIARELYLLEVEHPFMNDGEEVRYLLACPRHVGNTLDDVMGHGCSVGITRLKPGVMLTPGDQYDGSEYEYWAIGSIKVRRA